jgi:hypothetical protein
LVVRCAKHREIRHRIDDRACGPDVAGAAERAEKVAIGEFVYGERRMRRRQVRQTMRRGDDIARLLGRNDVY